MMCAAEAGRRGRRVLVLESAKAPGEVPQANPSHSTCAGFSTVAISMESGAEMSCFIAVCTSTLFRGGLTRSRAAWDCRLGLIDKTSAAIPDPTSREAEPQHSTRGNVSL